ncbi:MAG TPA: DUF349 domain-containing protein [Frankiaceae bacterium]|nr:DUF349 domain-containing protein [Frankiaceae bacterium]
MEQPPVAASGDFGRVDEEGTVYVRTPDGERVVGSWLAGSPEAGLAYFVRKFEDLAAEVAILEKRVDADPNRAATSAARLRGELAEAAVVGNLAALDARLAVITDAAAVRQSEVAEQRAVARAEAVTVKEALVAEAEQLAAGDDWRHADEQMRALVERWKALGRLDRKTDDALWTRLAAARSGVQRRRRVHFAELEEKRKGAQARKTELVAEAEKLVESTSWGPTTARFRDLMTEWKAAGGAPKGAEAELWGRFRAAQDAFFAARSASRAERDAGLKAALAAREELVVEAETLDPASDAVGARKRLRDIQRRWDATPTVPRDSSSSLDRRLGAVEDRLRDAEQSRFRPDPTDNPLVIRLNESIEKLERRIKRAEQSGDAKALAEAQATLETQRGWLAQATGRA